MAVDNISVRQTWLAEETERCAHDLSLKKDLAFLYLAAALILECSPSEVEAEDVVEGHADKQIDFVHILDDTEKAEITLIQAKNSPGFSSNIAIQIANGLSWIFERPKAHVAKIENTAFRDKVFEIRALRTQYGASNIAVNVYHVTTGDSEDLSQQYLEEAQAISAKYKDLFAHFEFTQLGADELIELLNKAERSKKKIDLDLPILYDVNRGSIIEATQGGVKSLICTVSGTALAEAAQEEPRDAIFDLNVRPFYGTKGKVNKDILKSCTGDDSDKFWLLNNGVTLVCDDFTFNRDPDDPIVKIWNAQIVNGCQTTVSLRHALEGGTLAEKVNTLLRIYATDSPSLVEKITLTTNNQNKVTDRDLRANDPVQRDIARVMLEKYGHYYERKNRQFRNLPADKKKLIVPSPKAAQAYLAIVRGKPSSARGYLAAIWSDYYEEIFQAATVIDLLFSYRLLEYCRRQARKMPVTATAREQACRVYGAFHIARSMGKLLAGNKWGSPNTIYIEQLNNKLTPSQVEKAYKTSLATVMGIRQHDEKKFPIPALYFKHGGSELHLNSVLNAKKA